MILKNPKRKINIIKHMIKSRTFIGLAIASCLALALASLAGAEEGRDNSVNPQAGPKAVGTTLETHINNDGKVLVRGAKITSISGTTVNARQNWGSYNLSWVVNVSTSTELLRRYGGASSLSEFTVGDYISFSGPLDNTQSQATVNAKVLKDFSIQKVNASFSGTVSSVNASNLSFVLATKERGNITVNTSASTTFKQGDVSVTFAALAAGQTISKASGVWDTVANTLAASDVKIYVNNKLMEKRIFEGTMNTVPGATAPTTFSFTSGGTAYTVNVAANTSLLSKEWNPLQLSGFQANDSVRIYGAVEASSTSVIDAYIVRNASR